MGFAQEISPGDWDLAILENLPGGCPGDGNAWN